MMSLTFVLPDAIIKVNTIEPTAFLGNQTSVSGGGGSGGTHRPNPLLHTNLKEVVIAQHHGST